MKLLVTTDGSERAQDAVRFALDLARQLPQTELHLLNVQSPLPGAVTSFLQPGTAKSFHDDCSREALAKARALLDESGVAYHAHARVGDIGSTIVAVAAELGCDQIIMSTRGLGAIAGFVLGSTALKVLSCAEGPVTLITGS